MPYTHDFTLKVGEYTHKGELEFSESGLLGWKAEESLEGMTGNTEGELKQLFDILAGIFCRYSDLTTFKVTKKE